MLYTRKFVVFVSRRVKRTDRAKSLTKYYDVYTACVATPEKTSMDETKTNYNYYRPRDVVLLKRTRRRIILSFFSDCAQHDVHPSYLCTGTRTIIIRGVLKRPNRKVGWILCQIILRSRVKRSRYWFLNDALCFCSVEFVGEFRSVITINRRD